MSDLRFGVLGRLEVVRGARSVQVPAGRRRAVLACLLVHADRPVPADVLIEAAWRDDLPGDPRAALHTVLSRLRTALGADVLAADAAGYTLQTDEGSVDAHRFDALRDRARSAPPEQAAALLREALGLWRGPAYDEYADRDFAAPEAQRLERSRLDAVEEHAALAIEAGAHEEAAVELEGLLVEHPFREHAVELLMTALYRAGRQTEALERYRAHRELLAEELGLDPSPTLRDLESRILGHDVPTSARSRSVEAPAWLDTSTAFFGRDSTLAELVAATPRRSGAGLVSGGAGAAAGLPGPGGLHLLRRRARRVGGLAGPDRAAAGPRSRPPRGATHHPCAAGLLPRRPGRRAGFGLGGAGGRRGRAGRGGTRLRALRGGGDRGARGPGRGRGPVPRSSGGGGADRV